MKTILQGLACFTAFLAFLQFAPAVVQGREAPQALFEQAQYIELGRGDMSGAAILYRQVVDDKTAPPDIRARAQLRLALCTEKTGDIRSACSLLIALLRDAEGNASLAPIADDAAMHLLRLEESPPPGMDETQVQEAGAALRRYRPRLSAAKALASARAQIALKGRISTWDGKKPDPVTVRIEAKPAAGSPDPSGKIVDIPIWLIHPDPDGRFESAVPPGTYDIVVTSPYYSRGRHQITIYPEIEGGVAQDITLQPVQLPTPVQEVVLAGSWLDDWKGTALLTRVADGMWELRQRLPAGEYSYKFIVNGYHHWLCDVRATNFVDDGRSGFNTRLVVPQEQEVVFVLDEHDAHFNKSLNEKKEQEKSP